MMEHVKNLHFHGSFRIILMLSLTLTCIVDSETASLMTNISETFHVTETFSLSEAVANNPAMLGNSSLLSKEFSNLTRNSTMNENNDQIGSSKMGEPPHLTIPTQTTNATNGNQNSVTSEQTDFEDLSTSTFSSVETDKNYSRFSKQMTSLEYDVTFEHNNVTSYYDDAITSHVPIMSHNPVDDLTTISSFRVLNLTSEEIIQCVKDQDYLQYEADEGVFLVDHNGTEGNTYSRFSSCKVQITVPKTKIVQLIIHELQSPCNRNLAVTFVDARLYKTLTSQRSCSDRRLNVFFSYSYKVTIELSTYEDMWYYVYISFRAVAPTLRPHLEVIYTTPFSGYVQTPGWEKNQQYPPLMESMVTLQAPPGYSIMLSFVSVDILQSSNCLHDKISLYRGNSTNKQFLWNVCLNDEDTQPTVYNDNVLSIRFTGTHTLDDDTSIGFRIRFSFHENSSAPQKLADSFWNCSVPNWSDFQFHFPCNLQEDCLNGEDELECPYSSPVCGRGRLFIQGRCYIYFNVGIISWNDASVECMLRGSRLASLNTLEEWVAVASTLYSYDFRQAFIGFQSSLPSTPHLYRNTFQWSDGTVIYYAAIQGTPNTPACGSFKSTWFDDSKDQYYVSILRCMDKMNIHVLCELEDQTEGNSGPIVLETNQQSSIHFQIPVTSVNISHVVCPNGHVTHTFLACDIPSECWSRGYKSSMTSCPAPLTPLPPSFRCASDLESVPYSLLCDHRSDCGDDSDEDFCVFPACTVAHPFRCGNKQCVSMAERCDSVQQCMDGDDELQCVPVFIGMDFITPSPPAVMDFDGKGDIYFTPLGATDSCPDTHFECLQSPRYYCLPVFVRCNGMVDCPGGEDEKGCESFTCLGFYRCRGSRVCLHPLQVCDGIVQCPQRDDELNCGLVCPDDCICYGLALICTQPLNAVSVHSDLLSRVRYLDLQGSNMTLQHLKYTDYLVYLSLARCHIAEVDLPVMPNLRTLDLSDNGIVSVDRVQLQLVANLRTLILAGNPMEVPFFGETDQLKVFQNVEVLDLSRISIPSLNISVLSLFPQIQLLNLSFSGVEEVLQNGFQPLEKLNTLDLHGNSMTFFPETVFSGLDDLRRIWADNYKLCCSATLPKGFNIQNCHAPSDEISSCESLLRSDVYRIFLSVFASLSLLGNAGSFVYRVFIQAKSSLGFDVFVTHLCVADFFMGVYLAVIGIADRVFQGTYLWNDLAWKESVACRTAGFLSLLSREVSSFCICLITIDRFLVLKFPFSDFHFRKRSAQVSCLAAWLIGVVLAGIPLLPMTAHWEFYSQNGICLPLPITRKSFPGHDYSFSLIIVLNFVLFVFIALGQLVIYCSIRAGSMSSSGTTRKSRDFAIARRLITIAMSDFLCWFPIGLLGLLASSGAAIPGEVNVVMAILVLPLNSALNPFLYTLNVIMERRRLRREQRMKKILMAEMKPAAATTTARTAKAVKSPSLESRPSTEEVWKTFTTWLKNGVLSKERAMQHLAQQEN